MSRKEASYVAAVKGGQRGALGRGHVMAGEEGRRSIYLADWEAEATVRWGPGEGAGVGSIPCFTQWVKDTALP